MNSEPVEYERPTVGEWLGALGLALLAVAGLWLASVMVVR